MLMEPEWSQSEKKRCGGGVRKALMGISVGSNTGTKIHEKHVCVQGLRR